MATLSTYQRRPDGRGLLMHVARGAHGREWIIAALEVEAPELGKGRAPTEELIAGVFAGHAHQSLPVQTSLPKAIAAAEKYARWWLRSAAQLGACECPPIPGEITAGVGKTE